jgi:hypothetical protein
MHNASNVRWPGSVCKIGTVWWCSTHLREYGTGGGAAPTSGWFAKCPRIKYACNIQRAGQGEVTASGIPLLHTRLSSRSLLPPYRAEAMPLSSLLQQCGMKPTTLPTAALPSADPARAPSNATARACSAPATEPSTDSSDDDDDEIQVIASSTCQHSTRIY